MGGFADLHRYPGRVLAYKDSKPESRYYHSYDSDRRPVYPSLISAPQPGAAERRHILRVDHGDWIGSFTASTHSLGHSSCADQRRRKLAKDVALTDALRADCDVLTDHVRSRPRTAARRG